MPILRILLLLALGAAGPALAETLSTDAGNPAAWAAWSWRAIHFSSATCWPGAARYSDTICAGADTT